MSDKISQSTTPLTKPQPNIKILMDAALVVGSLSLCATIAAIVTAVLFIPVVPMALGIAAAVLFVTALVLFGVLIKTIDTKCKKEKEKQAKLQKEKQAKLQEEKQEVTTKQKIDQTCKNLQEALRRNGGNVSSLTYLDITPSVIDMKDL